MRKLLPVIAIAAAATAALPATAPAKAKPKPKPAVYAIYGGYDLTSVIYTSCVPPGGGVVNETTRVKRHFAYSGDTRRGITVKETEQEFLIRESTNEYLPSNSIAGEPRETTYKSSGAITIGKKGTGWFAYDGIGSERDRLSFRAPKKPGDAVQIKPDSNERHNEPDPGVGCTVAWSSTEASGALLVKRIQ
jgi:hypothetical protein